MKYDINTVDKLIKIISHYEGIYLYGAGKVGELIYSILKYLKGSKRCSFIDSKAGGQKNGIPILCIEDIGMLENECIIITASAVYRESICKNLESRGIFDAYMITEKLIGEIRLIQNIIYEKEYENDHKLARTIPQRQLSFSVHLCEHCNLNCAGCSNFSPLAKEEYTDINIYKSDMERLAYLSKGEAYRIQLSGGGSHC